jgi:dienelactone hydrolase
MTQLSLVEHALCPLNTDVSLRPNMIHSAAYFFTDKQGARRKASARVVCPDGLSAFDELYLWGLLALTFSQPEPAIEFTATPHYCLRQLGLIDHTLHRGGKTYKLFRGGIERLSAVTYQNDNFYDPLRGEHCQVSFGFFSYRLPLSKDSSRAWRFYWDPLFFEICQATRSALAFDLGVYRQLDNASRRLYLLLKKMFWRRTNSLRFDVRHLAVNVLGFAAKALGTANSPSQIAELGGDMASALAYLAARPEIDARRLGLMGTSQAGWVMVSAAERSPLALFVVAVTGSVESVGTNIRYEELRDLPIDEAYARFTEVGPPSGYDPAPVLQGLATPTLWLLGGQDRLVPTRECVKILTRLRSLGARTTFVVYPEAQHGLQSEDFWPDIDRFLGPLGLPGVHRASGGSSVLRRRQRREYRSDVGGRRRNVGPQGHATCLGV